MWQKLFPILFFVGGVIFDMITLDRIDSAFAIFSQLTYLSLATVLMLSFFWHRDPEEPSPRPQQPGESPLEASQSVTSLSLASPVQFKDYISISAFKQRVSAIRPLALHFCFGSLLSAYTIFYFKSASLVVSFFFLLSMVVLLLANEVSHFRKLGVDIKFGLLSLCWLSYSAYMIPILVGSIGAWVFAVSLAVGVVPMGLIALILKLKAQPAGLIRKQVLIPAGVVMGLFLFLYVMRWIPPVPLSIQYMGVFHHISKEGDEYHLSHERPWWRFWHRGDQWFVAQSGDQIHVFFRLFSPTGFKDQVQMHWEFRDPQAGWQTTDRIPISVMGGREEGFRGFGRKSNYQAGRWRVRLLSADQREIGRIGFRVTQTEAETQRQWRTEVH